MVVNVIHVKKKNDRWKRKNLRLFFWTDDINYISQLLSFKIKKTHLSPVKVKKKPSFYMSEY